MKRVLARTLSYDSDKDLYYLDGEPFTGIAFTLAKDGSEKAQMEYLEGLRSGLTTEWYKPGQPMVESNYLRGVLHGSAREWHRNGKLAEEGTYEFGIAIVEKEWDENGQLTKDYKLQQWDENYQRLLRLRAAYGPAGP